MLDGGAGTVTIGDSQAPSNAVLWTKILLGPIGWIALAAEAPWGSPATFTPYDKVPDDQAPASGMGRAVHPMGIVVPNAGTDSQPWRSTQGALIDGRRYDFLVDRRSQGWWPSDDDPRSGYRGRWGQQVQDNPNGYRAGMRFPPIWKMFLLAIEDGRSTKQLL